MKCLAALAAGLVDGSNDDRLSDFIRVPGLALRSGPFSLNTHIYMYENFQYQTHFTRRRVERTFRTTRSFCVTAS